MQNTTNARTTLALLAASVAAYALAFVLLYPALGNAVAAFSTLPVVAFGWSLGLRFGLVAGLLGLPVNSVLVPLVAAPREEWFVLGNVVGHAVLPLVGAAAGYVRGLNERVAGQARELEHRALHDPLTGLPNRALFSERLEQALARARRRKEPVAVLFLDLDNFKYVNDSLGHDAGDGLLVEVAGRLRGCLRPEDTLARLGGDEFVVLLEDVEGVGGATRIAERITEELRAPFVPGGQEVFVTPSIGIALGGPGHKDEPEDLLRKADVAMYRAKEGGKARHEVFDLLMEAETTERLKLENDLRRAIERDEFVVHYQPVVALNDTARIVGMEALVRWEHPERGLVAPSGFVSLAEEIGLIVPIGRRVLKEACRQAGARRGMRPGDPADLCPTVGVNLSARQIRHPGLVEEVQDALRESGLDPGRLTLEDTESAFVGHEEHRIATLLRLRDIGVRFAIDDFGTGYSALSYLKRLPAGLVKIDRSFVEGLGEGGGSEDEVLLSGVVGIAHGLGLVVVAEGVETPEQLERVGALGCDLAQGHLFSAPLPAEEAGALLASGLRRA